VPKRVVEGRGISSSALASFKFEENEQRWIPEANNDNTVARVVAALQTRGPAVGVGHAHPLLCRLYANKYIEIGRASCRERV